MTEESLRPERADVVVASNSNVRLAQSFQFLTLGAGNVPPNMSVRVCARADTDCVRPLSADLTPDADGWVDIPLFYGFNGYIEVRADGVQPSAIYLGEPLKRARPSNYPIALIERSILPGVTGAAGSVQTPDNGLVTVRSFDCQDVSASGVSYQEQQGGGLEFYYLDGLPTSAGTATGPEGLGGFINAPPGLTVVSISDEDGLPLAAEKLINVRPDWTTSLRVWVGEEVE